MLQLIRILSLIGVWLSSLSLYEYLSIKSGIEGLSVCKIGQSFDCGAVAQSEWSMFWGLPLASWGITYYFAIFLFGILALKKDLIAKQTVANVCLILSTFASIFSIYLFGISYFMIGKLCPLCIGMYLVNFSTFGLSLWFIRPLSFITAFSLGIKSFFRVGLMFLGIKCSSREAILSRGGIVIVCTLLFATTVIEDYISGTMILPKVEINKDFVNWQSKSQELIDIKIGNLIDGDFSIGRADAPIQIVEFSDYQCPACRRMYATLKSLMEEYKGNIHLISKNFPLDNYCNSIITKKFHEHACYAANIARCAGEQGKFWEMSDYINNLSSFDKEPATLVRDEIDRGGSVLGLDTNALKECVKSERHLQKIKQDIEEGLRLSINATPALWVNGKRLESAGVGDLRAIFDSILKK